MKVNKIIYMFSPFRHLFMAFKKMPFWRLISPWFSLSPLSSLSRGFPEKMIIVNCGTVGSFSSLPVTILGK